MVTPTSTYHRPFEVTVRLVPFFQTCATSIAYTHTHPTHLNVCVHIQYPHHIPGLGKKTDLGQRALTFWLFNIILGYPWIGPAKSPNNNLKYWLVVATSLILLVNWDVFFPIYGENKCSRPPGKLLWIRDWMLSASYRDASRYIHDK